VLLLPIDPFSFGDSSFLRTGLARGVLVAVVGRALAFVSRLGVFFIFSSSLRTEGAW
jgi:hypothetical protein